MILHRRYWNKNKKVYKIENCNAYRQEFFFFFFSKVCIIFCVGDKRKTFAFIFVWYKFSLFVFTTSYTGNIVSQISYRFYMVLPITYITFKLCIFGIYHEEKVFLFKTGIVFTFIYLCSTIPLWEMRKFQIR